MIASEPSPLGWRSRLGRLLALWGGSMLALAAGTEADPATKSSADATDPAQVVELAPFHVEGDTDTAWLIARVGHTEVLSRCSPDQTATLINRYQRLNAMLAAIYPPALHPEHDVPAALFIDDRNSNPATDAVRRQKSGTTLVRTLPGRLSNFHRWDQDSQAIHFVLSEFDDELRPLTITTAYLRYLLETRTPTLPRWFIEGLVTLRETVVLPVPPVAEREGISDVVTVRQSWSKFPYDQVTVQPFIWQGHEETGQMLTLFKRTSRSTGRFQLPDSFPFLPLAKLFNTTALSDLTPAEAAIFPYQAALLIRWALDPNQSTAPKPTAAALWQFVADHATNPDAARQFSATFGESMAQMETHLKAYLPFACLDSSTFALHPPDSIDLTPPTLKSAAAHEVSLIKGRFERLETIYIRSTLPELTDDFAARARGTLLRTNQADRPPPAQLAELGLLEIDLGNPAAARPLLVEAAQARVVHPRVYLELARLDYEQLRKSKIDWANPPPEVARLEEILRIGAEQRPALPDTYQLLFDLWLQHNRPPTPREFLLLQRGPQLFPRHFRIIYAAALLQTTHGNPGQARQLLTQSLPLFPAGPEHARLVQLQQALDSAGKN